MLSSLAVIGGAARLHTDNKLGLSILIAESVRGRVVARAMYRRDKKCKGGIGLDRTDGDSLQRRCDDAVFPV